MEIWKDIKGYEGLYQVSNLGRVKSLSRYSFGIGRSRRKIKERILVITTINNQYSYVTLSNVNGGKHYKVHKLVAEHFLGHKTDGTQALVIDHINNIKSDNRLENLQIITQRENASKDKKNASSMYTGVGWYKNTQKWRAKILIKDKTIHLGYFDKEYDAHLSYQNALKNI